MLAEIKLARRFGVPPPHGEGASKVFERGQRAKQADDGDIKVKALHAKIGLLAIANEFLQEKLAPWIDK
ncbi:MAG: hypothetical protein COB24_02040 [Hyphomicrobiales bacterium]|nr:MAG: hypothetical protein COB24_02040 [Hyphomicrobiales bacterium]